MDTNIKPLTVRLKGQRARRVTIIRTSLKEINTRLRIIARNARSLRRALRRTRPNNTGDQGAINSQLLYLKQPRENLLRYLDGITFVP